MRISLLLLLTLLMPGLSAYGEDLFTTIDFEGLPAGKIVTTVDGHGAGDDAGPILVSGSQPLLPGENAAIIFDSSNPPGLDFDLGTPNGFFGTGGPGVGFSGRPGQPNENAVPLGNLLIFADDLVDADEDGLVDIPNDADRMGMVFNFDFTAITLPFIPDNVTVLSLTAIDIEVEQGELPACITLFDADDNVIDSFEIGNIGCNGVKVIETGVDGAGTAGVARMEVLLNGSGAIDNIELLLSKEEEECEPCDGKVNELTLQYNGDEPAWIKVKQVWGWQTVFEGVVDPGEQFTFHGTLWNCSLGSKIKIFVDGCFHIKIITNCKCPIGPGLVKGDFEVVAGSSTKGGELCPIEDDVCTPRRGKYHFFRFYRFFRSWR